MRHVVVLVALLGCGDQKPEEVPVASCDPEMRQWILDCIEKANPHADEEPEDNTKQCEMTAIHLFCGTSCFLHYNGGISCHVAQPIAPEGD